MNGETTQKWYKRTAIYRLAVMYREGFGNSKLARQLLWIIIFKVAILLIVFKLILMPNWLSRNYDSDEDRAVGVRSDMVNR